MIPKGALIGLGTGIVGAFVLGLYFADVSNQPPSLNYVEGVSLSIITEKTNFKLGEDITIKIINSGSIPLVFSDSSYGMKIIGLDGRILFSPAFENKISILEPREEKTFVWHQIKSDGEKIIEGRYKIISSATDSGGTLEKSLVINIVK